MSTLEKNELKTRITINHKKQNTPGAKIKTATQRLSKSHSNKNATNINGLDFPKNYK